MFSTIVILSLSAQAGQKVQLCHQTGSGKAHLIEVSVNAVDAHMAHGDWFADGADDCETAPDTGDTGETCPSFMPEVLGAVETQDVETRDSFYDGLKFSEQNGLSGALPFLLGSVQSPDAPLGNVGTLAPWTPTGEALMESLYGDTCPVAGTYTFLDTDGDGVQAEQTATILGAAWCRQEDTCSVVAGDCLDQQMTMKSEAMQSACAEDIAALESAVVPNLESIDTGSYDFVTLDSVADGLDFAAAHPEIYPVGGQLPMLIGRHEDGAGGWDTGALVALSADGYAVLLSMANNGCETAGVIIDNVWPEEVGGELVEHIVGTCEAIPCDESVGAPWSRCSEFETWLQAR